MTDLVKQLRIMGAWFESDGWTANASIAIKGADEIERLRAIAIERMDLFKQAASRVEVLEMTLRAPAQTPTWQPAETAPKDGTEILGLCDWEHNCTVVLFYQSGQWLVRWDHSQFDDGFALTHWMPIPTPPSLVSSTPSEPAQRCVRCDELERDKKIVEAQATAYAHELARDLVAQRPLDREAVTNAIIDNMPTLNGLNAAVDAIMALTLPSTPSEPAQAELSYAKGVADANEMVGALWSDLFNKDMVNRGADQFFDKWRDRIKALSVSSTDRGSDFEHEEYGGVDP